MAKSLQPREQSVPDVQNPLDYLEKNCAKVLRKLKIFKNLKGGHKIIFNFVLKRLKVSEVNFGRKIEDHFFDLNFFFLYSL